jgi:hypothetical protein
MSRASTSLPVPDSPTTSTVQSLPGDAARQVDDQSRRRINRNRLQRFAQTLFGAHLKPQHFWP